jgi:hypothetical protein
MEKEKMQKQLYGIAIYEEAILLSDFTGRNPKRFVVEQEQLMELFKFNKHVTLKPFEGLVHMKAQLEGDEEYLVTFKRQKKKIIHSHKNKLSHIIMEMPNLAIMAYADDNYVRVSEVYAYPGTLTKSTPLYELPLPNISHSRLCLGSVQIQINHNMMKAIETAFYETPFNHHSHLAGRENLPFLDYVQKYKGRMPFHSLNQIGTGRDILED